MGSSDSKFIHSHKAELLRQIMSHLIDCILLKSQIRREIRFPEIRYLSIRCLYHVLIPRQFCDMCKLLFESKWHIPSVHNNDVIIGAIASQITSLTIVYSIVYSSANQRKHQRSASLAFVRGIHRWPVNSSHKWPVMRKMFPFNDVIMQMSPRDELLF